MFNVNEAPESKSFEAVEPGLYRATVMDVAYHNNKAGTGTYFCFEFALEPSGMVKDFITFEHGNQTASEIGKAKLGDLLFCVQVGSFASVEELKTKVVGKELVVEVGKEIDGDKTFNRVEGYWSLGGKHRNVKRCMAEVKLGPNGKKPKVRRGSTLTSQIEEDVPF